MRSLVASMALSVLSVTGSGWSAALGSTMSLEGAAPFGFAAWLTKTPALNREGTLTVMVTGLYPRGTQGRARLELPAGLELVAGDTARLVDMADVSGWTIRVVPRRIGSAAIRGIMTIRGKGFVDEGEFVLGLDVGKEGARVERARVIRKERISKGQRYRFGGQFLVPVDSSECVMESDIDPVHGKPQVIEEIEAIDSLGARAAHVRFVAFVDGNGSVRGAHRIDLREGTVRSDSLGREALMKWRFRPATANGRSVADWVIVEVRIRPLR